MTDNEKEKSDIKKATYGSAAPLFRCEFTIGIDRYPHENDHDFEQRILCVKERLNVLENYLLYGDIVSLELYKDL